MLKIFFASTAIATTLGFAALAQEATDPLAPQPDAPVAPAPEAPGGAPAPEAQATEPVAPMGTEPSTETAQEPAADPTTPGTMMTEPAMERALTPVATADITADKLIGATIETRNAENIAEVDDVLMGPDGRMESIVATFGGFLGFGSDQVLLTPDEIEVLQDQSGTFVVQTDLTPEALEGRPTYQPEQ